ncbi:MAG TPA: hypothetical protein VJJ83_04890 [Candidatus Babeliales bacterium]|nr:hypothetical protein [Candidatus Babeliales bacterium]
MQKFLALLLGVSALSGLSGCKQLGCDKPATPATEAAAVPANEPATEAAPAVSETAEDKAA